MRSAETLCWEALIGVGEDFAKFKDNYQITREVIGSISYRYKDITRQLNADSEAIRQTLQMACTSDPMAEPPSPKA